MDFAAGPRNAARPRVDLQVGDPDGARPVYALAADQGVHPRQELADIEWLRQIVVGAGLESLDTIADRPASGEHQDQHGAAARPELFTYSQSVDARQHQVHHEQPEIPVQRPLQARNAVGRDLDVVVRLLQTALQPLRQGCLVLDDQYSHRNSSDIMLRPQSATAFGAATGRSSYEYAPHGNSGYVPRIPLPTR